MSELDPLLESRLMSLPAEQRERLAERLMRSLDRQPLNEVDHAWVDEAERRFAEWQRGEVEGVPGNQMTARIRRELGWSD